MSYELNKTKKRSWIVAQVWLCIPSWAVRSLGPVWKKEETSGLNQQSPMRQCLPIVASNFPSQLLTTTVLKTMFSVIFSKSLWVESFLKNTDFLMRYLEYDRHHRGVVNLLRKLLRLLLSLLSRPLLPLLLLLAASSSSFTTVRNEEKAFFQKILSPLSIISFIIYFTPWLTLDLDQNSPPPNTQKNCWKKKWESCICFLSFSVLPAAPDRV